MRVTNHLTLGINSCGNTRGLLLSLFSVLQGSMLPKFINLRFEGDVPGFNDFYLEQLLCLARSKGVQCSIVVSESKGIRNARDWHLDNTTTPHLVTLDDDVVLDSDAIRQLCVSASNLNLKVGETWSFICGNKRDLNNRRGYKDFSNEVKEPYDLCHTNHTYQKDPYVGMTFSCVALDTGFALFNMNVLRYSGLRFSHFKVHFNSGGEDNFFGIRCTKAGFPGYFAPSAQAVHLEKERQNFGEFATRAEMILRSAEAAGIADGKTELQVFPAERRNATT